MKSSFLLACLLVLGFAARAAAIDAPPTDAIVIDHALVDAGFAKGSPWLINTSYKVQAGHRVAAGKAELHEHDTDIFLVTEGSATLVTGGKLINPMVKGPGETLAEKIEGGTARKVTKGDLVVIPQGVPHWLSEVEGPFLYFVVKVTK